MFNCTAAHDGFFFKFQCPAFLSYIKNNCFHSQVLRSDLRTQSCTHTWVEEQETNSFIGAKCFDP